MTWNIFGLKGMRQDVKDKVTADDKLPEDVRAFIGQEIDRLPENCPIVKVDAYGQTHDGETVMRQSQVTVVGVKV